MLGYVEAFKPELKVRELEVYNGYYCGLCKRIGVKYGQVLRKGLSFDMAFLALFLEALSSDIDKFDYEHCISHPVQKKTIIRNDAVNYAADMMIILGYENYLDDILDGDKKTGPVYRILKSAYKKAESSHTEEAAEIHRILTELHEEEFAKCDSPDKMAEIFSGVMRTIFGGYSEIKKDQLTLLAASEFASYLGRWIYIMDAFKDMENDIKSSSYNPFIYRFGAYDKADDNTMEGIKSEVNIMLYYYLGEMSKAFDLLEFKKNKGILNNILFLGLRKKTDDLLTSKGEANE